MSFEAGIAGRPSHPCSIYVGPGDPNSGPLSYMVNALISESSHQHFLYIPLLTLIENNVVDLSCASL